MIRKPFIPFYGLLLWAALIVLFNRHDYLFYLASFLFSLSLTFLAFSHSEDSEAVKIEVETED